jgi:hypothetical protein
MKKPVLWKAIIKTKTFKVLNKSWLLTKVQMVTVVMINREWRKLQETEKRTQ